ncbi:hypothetical protein [Laribacter hongkongensis]|uniref:hypothetical protein n=1 Tax=Laribacter hongkongensis TaxID=168471 RepID=UPI0018777433|nr:hypothetical protein [Laribacter hongkongensis]
MLKNAFVVYLCSALLIACGGNAVPESNEAGALTSIPSENLPAKQAGSRLLVVCCAGYEPILQYYELKEQAQSFIVRLQKELEINEGFAKKYRQEGVFPEIPIQSQKMDGIKKDAKILFEGTPLSLCDEMAFKAHEHWMAMTVFGRDEDEIKNRKAAFMKSISGCKKDIDSDHFQVVIVAVPKGGGSPSKDCELDNDYNDPDVVLPANSDLYTCPAKRSSS